MILYSSFLQFKPSLTQETFINLVVEWNNTNSRAENIIPGVAWYGENELFFGDDNHWMSINCVNNIVSVRYEKNVHGIIWDTDYVANFDEHQVSILLSRSYSPEVLVADPAFSAPHFVSMLIERGYICDDHNLPISKAPLLINSSNISLLLNVINGESEYDLPVVYVSKTPDNTYPLDISYLGSKLKGIAHIFAEEDVMLNTELKYSCDFKNEYFGAIGIYYPTNIFPHKRLLKSNGPDSEKRFFDAVVSETSLYSNTKNIPSEYTWQGIKNALLFDRLELQRQERIAAENAKIKAEDEVSALYDTFDDELAKMQHNIESLLNEVQSLRCESQGLRAKLSKTDNKPIIYSGKENDFYVNEIKEIILSVLEEYLKNAPEGRRKDVVKDILEANDFQNLTEERVSAIKTVLSGYKNMAGATKQDLQKLGFVITDDGKHYKLTYYNDPRYMVTLSKTASDSRTGKNSASVIIKTMF